MRSAALRRALALFLALCAGAAFAHVPLRHPGTGKALHWSEGPGISFVIGSIGSDDLAPGAHMPAVRLAAHAWNTSPGSFARLVENDSPVQQASQDWLSSSLHLVMFDESNTSGFFPNGSATVAITPIWFYSNGRISDADILFNGGGFHFTTSGHTGRFDVQDIAVHEFGHFLGFDHSPIAGSSLFPYVSAGMVLHRSLAADDWMAARSRYPQFDEARLKGRVERADGSAVVRAHVVLRDAAGRTAGAALANSIGAFEFESVEPGTYELWIAPLDGPVTAANFSGAPQVDVDFQPTSHGPVTIVSGVDRELGAITVLPDAPSILGRSFDTLPLGVVSGATRTHVLRGFGLSPGSTLVAGDPDLTVVVHGWFHSSVSFSVTVPVGAAPGHVDLMAVNALGERALLPGALEIVPPQPTVSNVTPSVANSAGGTTITIHGSGFRPGATVVVGGRIFHDGAQNGATVIDSGRIVVTLPALAPGLFDLVVIDESGVEGRRSGALMVGGQPSVTSVFPAAGSSAGGTRVLVRGTGFDPGLVLSIDGVVQPVESVAPDVVEFTTTGGVAGVALNLSLQNPIGSTADGAFTYTPLADPIIQSVSPPEGPAGGGEWVTIHGAGLRSDLDVRFGADPSTGLGGSSAEAVTLLDSQTMLALAPAGSGVASIVLHDMDTGQAAALPAAYTYRSSASGGGCGGLVDVGGPGAPWLRGLDWVLLALGICVVQAVRARRVLQRLATV